MLAVCQLAEESDNDRFDGAEFDDSLELQRTQAFLAKDLNFDVENNIDWEDYCLTQDHVKSITSDSDAMDIDALCLSSLVVSVDLKNYPHQSTLPSMPKTSSSKFFLVRLWCHFNAGAWIRFWPR